MFRLGIRFKKHVRMFLIVSFLIVLLVQLNIYHINGHTHSSDPMLILVSFDGFRWDYLKNHDLPNFNALKQDGVHAEYIYNAYATVTFPNHWTIVTG